MSGSTCARLSPSHLGRTFTEKADGGREEPENRGRKQIGPHVPRLPHCGPGFSGLEGKRAEGEEWGENHSGRCAGKIQIHP